MTGAFEALLRETKLQSPKTLTMMYSTGATASADWRANGIDLERIARGGNLDIFVDQTWAGAWGEVGVREQTFWNAPLLGWTYQLGYLLEHAAVLAGSKVRHHPLVETFDAWESWDTIHTAPERLRWAIWAYSHAAVKTPKGLVMPAGSYISWGNHGHDLLSEADVALLSREMNAAAADAADAVDVAGRRWSIRARRRRPGRRRGRPIRATGSTSRSARSSNGRCPSSRRRVRMAGAGATGSVPGRSDGGMPDDQLKLIAGLADRGQPMAFFGSAAGATSPAIAGLFALTTTAYSPHLADRVLRAAPGAAWPRATMAAMAFDAPPDTIVYRIANSAGLIASHSGQGNLARWDPTPLFDYWFRPLKDPMNGERAGFAIAAAVLNGELQRADAFAAARIDVGQSGTIAACTRRDGSVRMLAGNLEEGLRDDADRTRALDMAMPARRRLEIGLGQRKAAGGRRPDLHLAPARSQHASRLLAGLTRQCRCFARAGPGCRTLLMPTRVIPANATRAASKGRNDVNDCR